MQEYRQLDIELKQLETITRLKNKLTTYINNLDKYNDLKRYDTKGNEDNTILKHRSIMKAKKIIQKYLRELRQDENFTMQKIDKYYISLNYIGKYVTCRRLVNF